MSAMKIIRDLNNIRAPFPNAVVTLGNFDGVHLGHREIFRKVVSRARAIGGTAVVFTFWPHPLKLIDPGHAPPLINTQPEKERLIAASGVDVLVCPPFTYELAGMPPEHFVDDVLVEKLGARHVIVGFDYAFGRKRAGNTDFLINKGREAGFGVEVLGPITAEGVQYSSTRIRELIAEGDISRANAFLGRNFNLEGTVVSGARRGKGLGFPTANLASSKELLPRPGVYAVKVRWRDAMYDGVVNLGWNPTFRNDTLSIEVHLIDFSGDLYGEILRVYFVERLRDEVQFASIAELTRAIEEDVRRARDILAQSNVVEFREYLADNPGAQGGADDARGSLP